MEYIKEKERIYVEDKNGKIIAEITFPGGVINHTFVDESLRGMGIASTLVLKAVTEIEKSGRKVVATCPYAIKWLEKNR